MTTSCGVPGFNLNIDKVIAIKAISGTKRVHERLSFKMEDGKRQIWPVQIVHTLDYRTSFVFTTEYQRNKFWEDK